jgi:hypothetical protein
VLSEVSSQNLISTKLRRDIAIRNISLERDLQNDNKMKLVIKS